MSVHHDLLTVSRDLRADVSTVFGLWTDTKALARWYLPGDENWRCEILEHDFRVGGRNHLSFGPKGEPPYEEDCCFQDIVTDERILYSMTVSDASRRLTTSLVTIEFDAIEAGTRMRMTEQIAILDGTDTVEGRRRGWGEVFDRFEKEI